MSRKYQEIWERIKRKGACSIECHPKMVNRVKKAVIKEKTNDNGFKVINDNDSYRLNILIEPLDATKSRIEFRLRAKFGLFDRMQTS